MWKNEKQSQRKTIEDKRNKLKRKNVFDVQRNKKSEIHK